MDTRERIHLPLSEDEDKTDDRGRSRFKRSSSARSSNRSKGSSRGSTPRSSKGRRRAKSARLRRRKSWRETSAQEILSQEKEGPYNWDEDQCGKNIVVIFDKPSIATRRPASQSTDGIRGCHGYLIGYHVFKFEFNDKPWGSHCMVGVCTRKAALQAEEYCHLIGSDKYGWGWDIPSKTLFHDGKSLGSFPQNPEIREIPRKFSMILDLFNGILSFDFGEERIEEAFTDLKVGKHHLFPMAALVYGFSAVRIQKEKIHPPHSKSAETLTCSEKEVQLVTTATSTEVIDTVTNKRDVIEADSLEDILNDAVDGIPGHRTSTPLREPTAYELYRASHISAETLSLREAQATMYSYDRPTLGNKFSTLSVSSYAFATEEILEPEPPGVEYKKIASLDEQDAEIVRFLHGWDFVKRGGLLHPYPNCPTVCVPAPSLNEKVQSIRSKQSFKEKSGKHTWKISEIRMFPPALTLLDEVTEVTNDVIVGVASPDHRSFNHGFTLNQLGPNAWGFEPTSKLLWHGDFFRSPEEEAVKKVKKIDLMHGIELQLDTHLKTLTFKYQGEELCQFKQLKGDQFFPFLLFNREAFYPVEIEYLEGPASYVQGLIEAAWKYTPAEVQDKIYNHRCMLKKSASFRGTPSANTALKNLYHWGDTSPNAEISMMRKNQFSTMSSIPSLAIAECPISSGRHQITFTFDPIPTSSCWAIGLESYAERRMPYVFGGDMHSWLWDLHEWCLYHAGRKLGVYPTISDINLRDFSTFKLTVDFGHLGYNTVSFSAVPKGSDGSEEKDLGIAFVNVAHALYPCVAIASTGRLKQTVRMEYVVGSWTPVSHKGRRAKSMPEVTQSKMCAIL